MNPRRLLSLWLGVIGELFIITAEVIESPTDPDELAIEAITDELRSMVNR